MSAVSRRIPLKASRETRNSPIEENTVIMMFNHNLTDFSEKAGLRRKRPRTKATFAATIMTVSPVWANKDTYVDCGLSIVVTTVTTAAIGSIISQPFSSIALTNLSMPDGAFRYTKRVSFPRTVTSPVTMTVMIGKMKRPSIRGIGGVSGPVG